MLLLDFYKTKSIEMSQYMLPNEFEPNWDKNLKV